MSPFSRVPNIRLLHIDTDPAIVREAAGERGNAGLGSSEFLITRLNRPSHYLKPRDGRASIDSWFNPKMLYRIPRNQLTTGLRVLGRLAFCDNYPAIVGRLQAELEACTEPDAMTLAMRQTQLTLRTNRPRVYVITNLAGGTGSGMFLDVAYVVRSLLRQLGYSEPNVTGLFLSLPWTGMPTRHKVSAIRSPP